jgi:hypothetical protein
MRIPRIMISAKPPKKSQAVSKIAYFGRTENEIMRARERRKFREHLLFTHYKYCTRLRVVFSLGPFLAIF